MIHRNQVVVVLAVVLFFASVQVGRSQWTVLHPSFLNPAGAAACVFVSKDSGFILGDSHIGLAITQDGGNTWTVNSEVPDTGDRIFFLNHNDGWLWSSYGYGTAAYFFLTTNHGTDWEKDSIELPSGLPLDLGAGAYFRDSLNGWYGTSGLAIFHTTDGGRTWAQQYFDDLFPDAAVQFIAFCNDSLGFAITGPQDLYILYTTDDGANWHNLSNLEPFLRVKPSGLVYTDPRHVWLSTYYTGPYSSTDSGKTWNAVPVPGSGFGIGAISFADSNHGIVVKRPQYFIDSNNITDSILDVVAYTSDGGQTWDTTLFHDAIRYASFPDTTTAYVCSYYNLYRLSTARLGVSSSSPALSAPWLEAEDGNFVVSMPQSSGGRLRIMDELGRVLDERFLSPGARYKLSSTSNPPQLRFVEVECGEKFQVFKVIE